MKNAIEIVDVRKTYANSPTETLHGISLTIKKGEFVGLLGPNGAGKTTTIACITGVSAPTSGSISVFGHDVVTDYREARAQIGVSPQEFNIDTFQTVDEILDFHAGFFGVVGEKMRVRREGLLTAFGLIVHRDKKFQFLSGGLKRRVVLAKALMHTPELLILDEPTSGVDVETRQALWTYVRKLHSEGMTILLTSHYLEEVEALCERVVILHKGGILLDKSMEEVKKQGTLEHLYLQVTKEQYANTFF